MSRVTRTDPQPPRIIIKGRFGDYPSAVEINSLSLSLEDARTLRAELNAALAEPAEFVEVEMCKKCKRWRPVA